MPTPDEINDMLSFARYTDMLNMGLRSAATLMCEDCEFIATNPTTAHRKVELEYDEEYTEFFHRYYDEQGNPEDAKTCAATAIWMALR